MTTENRNAEQAAGGAASQIILPRCRARMFDPEDREGLGCGFRCEQLASHEGNHTHALEWSEGEAVYRNVCDEIDHQDGFDVV